MDAQFKHDQLSQKWSISLVILACLLCFSNANASVVIYVDKDATGNNDGSSWTDAYTDINTAITNNAGVVTFWIAEGTYYPTGSNRFNRISPNANQSFYGGFNGTESSLNERDFVNNLTIFSGDINSPGVNTDNSHSIFAAGAVSIVLDGIHFTGGYNQGPFTGLEGGAAVHLFSSYAVFRNCSFYDNYADSKAFGGAVALFSNATAIFYYCRFYNNTSDKDGAAIGASAANSVSVYSSEFYNNISAGNGAVVSVADAGLVLGNTTIVGNTGASMVYFDGNSSNGLDITNSIFFDNLNTGGGMSAFTSVNATSEAFNYNLVEDTNPPGSNNIIDNPLFVDFGNNDFSLQVCSPAINVGDNSHPGASNNDVNGDPRIFDTTVDLGAHELQTVGGTASITSVSVTDVVCKGDATGEIIISATGTGTLEYSIDQVNYTTDPIFSGVAAGSYTVSARIAGSAQCLDTDAVTVSEPADRITITSVTAEDALCNGESGNLSVTFNGAGTGPYELSLDGGLNFFPISSTTESSFQIAVGTFNYVVKDANGCTDSETIVIGEPDVLTVSASVDNQISCNGAADGQVAVSGMGGTSPYEYSLDNVNFQTTPLFTSLTANQYDVYIKDANECLASTTIQLQEPLQLAATTQITDASCEGLSDGSISISAVDGTSPYSYALDGGTPQSSNVFSGLSAGEYTVQVFDVNGCEIQLANQVVGNSTTIDVTLTGSDVACNGDASGAISVAVSGGSGTYEYSIDATTFQDANTFTDLSMGNYTITVRDSNGCNASATITIGEPNALGIQFTTTDNLCSGDTEGVVDVSASGGTSPYEYSIDGASFQSASMFTGLSAGTYSVVVRDSQMCTASGSVTISEPSAIQFSVDQVGRKTFNMNARGGTAPYEYSTDGVNYQSSTTFDDLDPGTYSFMVRDANGCTLSSDPFDVVLGVRNPEVSIYPNPATEYVDIKGIDFDQVLIYNLEGKEVRRSATQRISVKGLHSGIHVMIVIKDGKEIHHQKLIIN